MLRKLALASTMMAALFSYGGQADAASCAQNSFQAGCVVNPAQILAIPQNLPLGSQYGPALTFQAHQNTGIFYDVATGGIAFSIGGNLVGEIGPNGITPWSFNGGTNASPTTVLFGDGTWKSPGQGLLPAGSPLVGADINGAGVTISPSAGLVVNNSNLLVPTYGTTANTIAQGNDSRIVNAFPATGGTISGALTLGSTLTLHADPASALQAATKQYVDTGIATASALAVPISGTTQFLGVLKGQPGAGSGFTGDGSLSFDMAGNRMNILKQLLTVPSGPGETTNLQLQNGAAYTLATYGLYPQVGAWEGSAFGLYDQSPGGACPPTWNGNSTAYAAGQLVISGGNIYSAGNTGTSVAGTIAAGPSGTGNFSDGTITWHYISAYTQPTNGTCGVASLDAVVATVTAWGQHSYQAQDVAGQFTFNQNGHDSAWGIDVWVRQLSGEPPQSFETSLIEPDWNGNFLDTPQANYDALHVYRKGVAIYPTIQVWAAWAATGVTYVQGGVNRVASIITMNNPSGVASVYKIVSCSGAGGTCQQGGSQPTFPASGTVTDGNIIWLYEGQAAPQFGIGFWLDGYDPNNTNPMFYGTGFATNGKFSNAVIDLSEASLVGFTGTGSSATAAGIRLAANMPIDFTANGAALSGTTPTGMNYQNLHTMEYVSADSALEYLTASTPGGSQTKALRIGDTGLITLQQITIGSSSTACVAGTVAIDANFIAVCTTANTWKHAALSAF